MGIVKCHVAISLDGAAGPDQSRANPLGVGGEGLHAWAFELDAWLREHGRDGGVTNASSAVVEEATADVGAGVMGRSMFGGGPRHARCVLHPAHGSVRRVGAAGANRVPFSGRIRGRALPPGAYLLVVTATDATGARSKPARVAFQVVGSGSN